MNRKKNLKSCRFLISYYYKIYVMCQYKDHKKIKRITNLNFSIKIQWDKKIRFLLRICFIIEKYLWYVLKT